MKDLKNILEGILNDIEDTLANSDKGIKAALYKQMINGIVSYNAKEQKNAVELFKQTLKDFKVKPIDFKDALKPESWWVQFKEHKDCCEFVMVRSYDPDSSKKYYIIYIDKYGTATKYWRVNTARAAASYMISLDNSICLLYTSPSPRD